MTAQSCTPSALRSPASATTTPKPISTTGGSSAPITAPVAPEWIVADPEPAPTPIAEGAPISKSGKPSPSRSGITATLAPNSEPGAPDTLPIRACACSGALAISSANVASVGRKNCCSA